jgi:hypothetical protein
MTVPQVGESRNRNADTSSADHLRTGQPPVKWPHMSLVRPFALSKRLFTIYELLFNHVHHVMYG